MGNLNGNVLAQKYAKKGKRPDFQTQVHGQGLAWLALGLTQPNPKSARVRPDFG